MSVDLEALRDAVARHGRVARVVVAGTAGSVPREAGAAMLVWPGGQSGTIGGGALEWDAAARAFEAQGARRYPLGPGLGQCCGGAVTIWTDWIDAARLADWERQTVIARGAGEMPLAVRRILTGARARGEAPAPQLLQGWMVEPVGHPARPLWIWGAGHVGRALVSVLAPLPDLAIRWADTGRARFPDEIPVAVTPVWAEELPALAAHAPVDAAHLILTYSHEIDLALCHALLQRGFGWCGLIGSASKKARFASRLAGLGHGPDRVARITCPIGDPALGKHPQAIALGVAAQLLTPEPGKGTAWPTSSSAFRA